MGMEKLEHSAYSAERLHSLIAGLHPYMVTFRNGGEVKLLTLSFKPGPLGIDIEEQSGCVGGVHEHGQARNLGVEEGMVLHNIDGFAFTLEVLDKYASGQSSYNVTFL